MRKTTIQQQPASRPQMDAHSAGVVCVSLLAVMLAVSACKPPDPTGIIVECNSNGTNKYYHWFPPNHIDCAARELKGGCYLPVSAEHLAHCYEKDEWLGTGDETGDVEDTLGIDRYTWPRHTPSLTYIKNKCTQKCRLAHKAPPAPPNPDSEEDQDYAYVCEEDNWIINGLGKVGLFAAYIDALELEDPGKLNCTPWYGRSNKSHIDPGITNIIPGGTPRWPSDGVDLVSACGDFETCASLFDEPVLSHLVRRNMDELTDDESEADFLATSSIMSSSSLLLKLNHPNEPSQASNWVGGRIEYTALDCGDSTCPFYLGHMTLTNTTDTWSLYSDAESDHLDVENIEIRLRRPVLGLWRPATGEVYLGDEMLDFSIGFDLTIGDASPTTMTKYATNDGHIFGGVGPDHTLEFTGLSVSDGDLTAIADIDDDSVDGQPPVASITLGPTYALPNDASGLQLSDITNHSSDPDDDLSYQLWIVDGVQVASTHQMGVGPHTIRLEVRDSRYAFDSLQQSVMIYSP
jgi:hypothetical protein